nr:retrovirus-related Pol polyprotein from transposon TNT 1-94 [Tanacetum cinerariifolium]
AIYRTKVCTEVCAGAIYLTKWYQEPGYDKQWQKTDSSASFHATYCKEELERFKLHSGKVRLADDKTLDIAVKFWHVVLKTSFGTSWTLKDARYTLGLKRRLILVGQLDEEVYHLGFKDQQWKVTKGSLVVAPENKRGSLYMVEVHPEGIGVIINGSGRAAAWFGEEEEYFLHNVSEDKENAELGVAERLSRTFRAESTWIRAEAPKMLWEYLVAAQMKCDTAFGIRRVTRLSEAEISHLWIRFMEPENDSIVAEHGLSSKITQSPGRSSDTSEGSANNESFEDSGRSYEEYFKDRASSKEGGSEAPHVRRSIRESRAPVRYSLSANYLLLTDNGELESYSEALSSKESVKEEQNGSKRYKARLVVKGFRQKQGLHEPSYVGALNDTSTQQKGKCFQLARQEENLECRLNEIMYRLIQAPRLRDVHQVGDEREVEVLRSFNSPSSELITDDYQREVIPSLIMIPCIESLLALRLVSAACFGCSMVQKGGPSTLEQVASCIVGGEAYCSTGFDGRIVGCKPNPTSVCSLAKLVRVLISEGSLSLLKILKTKSLADMFTSEPESYESVQWKAINEKMVLLEKNQTCSLVRLPVGKKASQRLWMFKVKEEHDGSKRYKARLVVKGFQQKRGVDYNEILSLVVKMTIIKLVLSIVAAGAFLCGSLE